MSWLFIPPRLKEESCAACQHLTTPGEYGFPKRMCRLDCDLPSGNYWEIKNPETSSCADLEQAFLFDLIFDVKTYLVNHDVHFRKLKPIGRYTLDTIDVNLLVILCDYEFNRLIGMPEEEYLIQCFIGNNEAWQERVRGWESELSVITGKNIHLSWCQSVIRPY
jgi:hypothetical protein